MSHSDLKNEATQSQETISRIRLVPTADYVKRIHHPKPKHDARQASLDNDEDQKGGPSSPRYRVTITRYGAKLLDVDNGAGGCKPLLDAMRYEGLIPDDDPGSIDFVFRQQKAKNKERRTEILLERL
jgi:hypothetical protein